MRYGTNFPLGVEVDPVAARDLAQTLDGAGYDYLGLSGHLLSAEAGRYPDHPAALYAGDYRDPFALFGFLAAVTERIGFRTGIIILPLYNTVHVARASAELANLSRGRFELGVGISWNLDEYNAVGQNFHERGRRVSEQIAVLRELWSKPYVTFEGRWHQINGLGLAGALPARPIPIWVGSRLGERALRRAAELAEGWIPLVEPSPEILARLDGYLEAVGRDRSGFGLALRFVAGEGGPGEWIAEARRLQAVGATDLSITAPPALSLVGALKRLVEAREAVAEAIG